MGWHLSIFDSLNELSKQYMHEGLPEEWEFSSGDDIMTAGQKLQSARQSQGIEFDERILEALGAFPDVVADVLVRIARTGFKNHRAVRWIWKPGYDFEINLSQARTGEVSVVVTTPYPDEFRPFEPTSS